MIYRAENLYRKIRRFTSRNRFIVWLFGMTKAANIGHQRGLIILQVDGLSHPQFLRAANLGRMPFLNSLLKNEHYRLHSLYSGVPSSTPAVQGELFYGVRGCVPAFKFKRPSDKSPVHMLDKNVAFDIEQSLSKQGYPLLKEGSAYSNLFTGGASESSFCASSLGWDTIIPSRNAYKMIVFAGLNIFSILRVLLLTVLEFFLAFVDFIRGVVGGRNLIKELSFVPMRVGASVLLRELVTIGVKLDAARGLPIIHANFLGYDEQSHRRGPASKFAHWSLKGLDRSIARIWRSAKLSEHRDYDIWIYSDHGQEATRSYPIEFNENIESAVNEAVAFCCNTPPDENIKVRNEPSSYDDEHRISLLGSKTIAAWLARKEVDSKYICQNQVQLASMGPLGLIYIDHDTTLKQHRKIAQRLVQQRHVPMAMVADYDSDGGRIVHVERMDGHWMLPRDSQKIFGAEHPFLNAVCVDTIDTVHHEFAGKVTLFGWHANQTAMSFRIEGGAHGGPGEQETHAFALIPEDTYFPKNDRNYLRFMDLHRTARAMFEEVEVVRDDSHNMFGAEHLKPKGAIRVMSYNIHSCIGMDGKVAPQRIARIINHYKPDIICLQEVDSGRANSLHIEQAEVLAAELSMNMLYHPVRCIGEEQFGNAVLSKHPMHLIEASSLTTNVSKLKSRLPAIGQDRGALHIDVMVDGKKHRIINTHLGVSPEERRTQVDDLLDESRFFNTQQPTILCGDFNATPNHYAYLEVTKKMKDVQLELKGIAPKKTFPSRYPSMRIDHVFVDTEIEVLNIFVPSNHMTKVASDHLPLLVDLRVK